MFSFLRSSGTSVVDSRWLRVIKGQLLMNRAGSRNSWRNGRAFEIIAGQSKLRPAAGRSASRDAGEGVGVLECSITISKPDVTFVGQWPRDDPFACNRVSFTTTMHSRPVHSCRGPVYFHVPLWSCTWLGSFIARLGIHASSVVWRHFDPSKRDAIAERQLSEIIGE